MPIHPRKHASHMLLLAGLLSLAGCFSLSRNAPPAQHYVLGAGGGPGAPGLPGSVAEAGPEALFVGMRTARLADYLASPFIVVRRGAHQVEFTEHHRWGEALGRAINRGVARRLSAEARFRVEAAPWSAALPPDRVIQLHILRFEGVAPASSGISPPTEAASVDPLAGEAHLLASWEVLEPGRGAPLARGSTEVRVDGWRVGDFHELVRLLDGALDTLARDLLEALARGSNEDPLPPSSHPAPLPDTGGSTSGVTSPPSGRSSPTPSHG